MKAPIDPENFDACPSYNDWLDQRYESDHNAALDISGFKPRPSYVLHQLSYDTYQAGLADYLSEREEELKEQVFRAFPSPIAYYYYRFENGYENDLQRLHFLRDTWESIIDVMHALTVAECRYRRIPLTDPIRFKDFLSDSIAQRALNIERIMSQSDAIGTKLEVEKLVDPSVLTQIRTLNQTRNAFSHSSAQSEKQAREWIGECYEEVIDVLDSLTGLTQIKLARYLNHTDATTLRCETFRGYHLTRTIETIVMTEHQAVVCTPCFHKERLFVTVNELFFTVQPFLHLKEDDSGHATSILIFRKARGDIPNRILEFEVVGKATQEDVDRSTFSSEINELRTLAGQDPNEGRPSISNEP
jgi:hypothetical protein